MLVKNNYTGTRKLVADKDLDPKVWSAEKIKDYNKFVVKQWAEIKNLDKKELLHLLASYDEYVRQIQENGGKPVVLAEFYYYEYLDYFNDWESDLL